MTYIENTYICLAAPLLLAILCMRRGWRRMLMFLLAGMTSCLFSAYISTFLAGATGIKTDMAVYTITPVVEETMKTLPMVFVLLVFEPDKRTVYSGSLLLAAGFATFENICFLTAYGTSDLLLLFIRGFGTGAMHIVCGVMVALGTQLLWNQIWLQVVGGFSLFCLVVTFHAVFNILISQTGVVMRIGSGIPLTFILVYMLFFYRRADRLF